ncbi:WD40 repeat domain-containing protein, partial [Candidatus Bathyarchaeota archaeon]|nr:WD40 repeat domain-containing protein [Candidatus Bathyarchaeota archaeon]
MLRNRWVLGQAPLQLYSSALIFSPTESKVRSQFRHLIPPWITRAPEIEDDWTAELSVLEGHHHWDLPIAFSPVDDLLASGSYDGTTRVWDYATGAELYKFTDASPVTCVLFSPDGRRLASVLSDGLMKVRDFAKGRSVDLVGHSNQVVAIAFSSTSIDTLVSISWDGTFRTWDTSDGREIHVSSFERFHQHAVALSPDAEFAARGFYSDDEPGKFVELWGVEQVDRRATFEADESTTTAIAISEDCKMVAAGTGDGAVKVWDVASGQTLHEDCYDGGLVLAIALGPQNEGLMAVGLSNGAIGICRVGSLNRIAEFNTGNWVGHLSLSRDDMLLAVGCHDGTVRLYDMTDDAGGAADDVSGKSPTLSVEFLPSEDHVVMSASSEVAHFWTSDDRLLQSVPGEVKKVHCSPDQSLVGLVMADKSLQLWSEGMARKLATYDDGEIHSITFSPDSLSFALRYSDMAMTRLLDSTTLEEKAKLHSYHEHPFVFSPDRRTANYVYTNYEKEGGTVHELRAFDLRTDEERVVAECQDKSRIAFSPDGQLVALDQGLIEVDEEDLASYYSRLTLFEVATGVERRAFTPTKSRDSRLAFHLADHLVVVAGWRSSEISLWSTASGSNDLHTLEVEGCEILRLAISPSGDLLVAAAAQGKGSGSAYETRDIHLWDLATRVKVGRFDLDFMIMDLSISVDSRYLDTSMGRIPLPPRITSEGATLSDFSSEAEQSCLYYTPQWVVQGLDNILWIPPAYREPHPAVR